MDISIVTRNKHKLITIEIQPNIYNIHSITRQILQNMKDVPAKYDSVVIDLSQVQRIESAVIAHLHNFQKRVQAKGASFALLSPTRTARYTLDLLGNMFKIYEYEELANETELSAREPE